VEKVKRRIRGNIRSSLAKRSRPIYSPITIPGTPENQHHDNESKSGEEKQDEDLDLYYTIYDKYKPELGESNAESVERTEAIEAEYALRKNMGKTRKGEETTNRSKH
jgi:hypothetical protein